MTAIKSRYQRIEGKRYRDTATGRFIAYAKVQTRIKISQGVKQYRATSKTATERAKTAIPKKEASWQPRFERIEGKRYRDVATGRIIKFDKMLTRIRIGQGVRRHWNTVRRIQKAHPDWNAKRIRQTMKKSRRAGRKFAVSWFGDYVRAGKYGYRSRR